MKNRSKTMLTALFVVGLGLQSNAIEAVSMESLLNEMVDRDAVARYPAQDFRLINHTSYNRASKTPDDPKGWFANSDFNNRPNSRNFIRTEENSGQKEWVMMEDEGPGAIVRIWQPFRGAPKDTLIRFYLDGSDTPALEGNPCTLLNGEGLIPYPFAHKSLLSAVSFFPITYAKSCKVTMTKMPYFYQITFRKYDAGTPVKSFTMADFNAAAAQVQQTGETLLNPKAVGAENPLRFTVTLETNQEKSIDMPKGSASVRELTVKLGTYDDPNVTRTTVLKMEFDGRETVWCPIGDFFGCGVGLNPVQGWYRTVAEDGTMSCRWVMPYQSSGKVSLVNLGGQPVNAELTVKIGGWKWDERSMTFNSMWRGQYPVPTQPRSDWNYVTIKGRGVYVADTLTIMNPVPGWWGEGDEKIWTDGESFPSNFGTGTEDYYAYSWGGFSTDFYEHPFHAQPHSNVYNKLNRKPKAIMDERDCRGFSVESRSRSLDTMPFGSSLQLDMEVWSGSDCDMGYQVGTMWYGFADTTSNRKPDPAEALNVPPLPNMSKELKFKKEKDLSPVPAGASAKSSSFENAVECEKMKIIAKTDGLKAAPQNLKKIKGTWSSSAQILVRASQVGDFVEVRIPASGTISQKLTLHATKSHDFGVLRFTVNGKPAGADVDLYAAKPIPSGPIELGALAPVDGAYILRAEVVGKNPKSRGTLFGLDCVTVNKVQ